MMRRLLAIMAVVVVCVALPSLAAGQTEWDAHEQNPAHAYRPGYSVLDRQAALWWAADCDPMRAAPPGYGR